MTQHDFLLLFRRCNKQETLKFMINRKRKNLPNEDMEAFYAAADHRLTEIIMGQHYITIPQSVWKWVHLSPNKILDNDYS